MDNWFVTIRKIVGRTVAVTALVKRDLRRRLSRHVMQVEECIYTSCWIGVAETQELQTIAALPEKNPRLHHVEGVECTDLGATRGDLDGRDPAVVAGDAPTSPSRI